MQSALCTRIFLFSFICNSSNNLEFSCCNENLFIFSLTLCLCCSDVGPYLEATQDPLNGTDRIFPSFVIFSELILSNETSVHCCWHHQFIYGDPIKKFIYGEDVACPSQRYIISKIHINLLYTKMKK